MLRNARRGGDFFSKSNGWMLRLEFGDGSTGVCTVLVSIFEWFSGFLGFTVSVRVAIPALGIIYSRVWLRP